MQAGSLRLRLSEVRRKELNKFIYGILTKIKVGLSAEANLPPSQVWLNRRESDGAILQSARADANHQRILKWQKFPSTRNRA